jgi:hypothetical protein
MQYHRFGYVLTFDTDVVLERWSKRWSNNQDRRRRIRRKVIALSYRFGTVDHPTTVVRAY